MATEQQRHDALMADLRELAAQVEHWRDAYDAEVKITREALATNRTLRAHLHAMVDLYDKFADTVELVTDAALAAKAVLYPQPVRYCPMCGASHPPWGDCHGRT